MDYLSHIRARGRGEELNVPTHLHNKILGRKFVESIGGPVPKLLATFSSPEEIDLDILPDSFVLKPTFSSSSFGVMVLERKEKGFYDYLRRRELSARAILDEQKSLADKHPAVEHFWMVEERIVDVESNLIPDDYKFFTFQGEIGLIHRTIRDSKKNRHAFFDGDFIPINDPNDKLIAPNRKIIEKVVEQRPEHWERLLNLAKRISVAVPSPFVRVDMYNTSEGPIFGEFTLVPGTFYYEDREVMMPELSFRLGYLWGKAQEKLGIS
ncbi:ATP-grasp fold amidoligase family protein [Pseudarthrobacter sp. PS3-L1]|uniref:ATP-grasp fold amidoligase family protein n=1 Tax=Pseudarthrobacter sp. PS3-L1 TaxID=3046207 RepID=UPI0024BAD90E|nr:ATP-grasp fold amidoligase family protein [Pseudarthrobacter sp. PS3-L1]MDJ0321723.1 ATP-grasp fold amidoligase family protein [Pseudarthrobacter sp. PS3-L1]